MKKIFVIFVFACIFTPYIKAAVKIDPSRVSYRIAEKKGELIKLVLFVTISDGQQEKSSKLNPAQRTITYTDAANFKVDSILDTIFITGGVKTLLYSEEIINAYLNAGKPVTWNRWMSEAERQEHWTGTYCHKEQLSAVGTIFFDSHLKFIILKTKLVKKAETEAHDDIITWLIFVLFLPLLLWGAVKLEKYDEEKIPDYLKARVKKKIWLFLLSGLLAIWWFVSRLIALIGLVAIVAGFIGAFILTLHFNLLFLVYIFIIIAFAFIHQTIKEKRQMNNLKKKALNM
ncbi:MAG: hypothetical protein WC467_04805 [Patescibacteria group bacterium]